MRIHVICMTALLILTMLTGCARSNVTPEGSLESGQTKVVGNQKVEATNDHLTVVIEKIERGDSIPDELLPPSYKKEPGTEGYDIVCVYLTITRIQDIYLFHPIAYDNDDRTFMQDANGHRYELVLYSVQGAVLTDPTDATSTVITGEGAMGTLIFELPVHEKPAKLSLVYSFNEICEKQLAKRGQLDISL